MTLLRLERLGQWPFAQSAQRRLFVSFSRLDNVVREKVFISPARYVQGPGILKDAYRHILRVGKSPVVIADPRIWKLVGNDFIADFEEASGSPCKKITFSGECSVNEIERILSLLQSDPLETEHDCVVGIGGGKTIDSSKAVAGRLDHPCIIVPTSKISEAC